MDRSGGEKAKVGLLERLPKQIKRIFYWSMSYSIWPIHYVTGCCSPEYMQLFGPRYDLERWGVLPLQSPRQSDTLIFVGNVTRKMMSRALRLYEQMPEPKWVVVIGACAISKGPFFDSYSLVRVKDYMKVDVFIAGCPPKPEAQAFGVLLLRDRILKGEWGEGGGDSKSD